MGKFATEVIEDDNVAEKRLIPYPLLREARKNPKAFKRLVMETIV